MVIKITPDGMPELGIKNAIKSYNASLIQELTKAGDEDLAKIIKRI